MGHFTTDQITDIVNAFIEAELWVGMAHTRDSDPDTFPADDYVDRDDLPQSVTGEMEAMARDFVALVESDVSETHVAQYVEAVGGDVSHFGHDFALTRQGHGAGFWDRGAGEAGDTLTHWAHTYRGEGLFVDIDDTGDPVAFDWD